MVSMRRHFDASAPLSPLAPARSHPVRTSRAHTSAPSPCAGSVFGWGSAACGQLGQDPAGGRALTPRATPAVVSRLLPPCAQLAAGSHHSLLLTQRGDVISFGKGTTGALGHGDRSDVTEPKPIMALAG